MDITYYLKKNCSIDSINDNEKINTNKINKINKNKLVNKLLQVIDELLNNNYVTDRHHAYLLNFIKKDGSIIYFEIINDIINIIKNNPEILITNKFILYFKKLYITIYDISYFNLNDDTIGKLIMNKIIMDKIDDHDNFEFTNDQKYSIINICNFLYESNTYGYALYGFAGTGKTTIIIKLIFYLLENKYIKSIIFTAPTNKALNIMKAKFKNDIVKLFKNKNLNETLNDQLDSLENNGYNINFLTIHKLLNYKNDYNMEGERVFIKGKKSTLNNYDLVVIDECSMISTQIINDIYNDVNNIDKLRSTKILFAGDPAQLPPVHEKMSIIFSSTDVNNKFNMIKSITMTEIVRSNDNNIIGLCNEIRKWIFNPTDKPNISKYVGGKVKCYKLYNVNNVNNKLNTNWFKKYINYLKNDNSNNFSNIILTWTNDQCDSYNNSIRGLLFDKSILKEYERGDILIFNDFYNISENKVNNKFYTSEQIKVTEVEEMFIDTTQFTISIPGKLRKIKNFEVLEKKLINIVKMINVNYITKYKVWKLYIQKLIEQIKDNIPHIPNICNT